VSSALSFALVAFSAWPLSATLPDDAVVARAQGPLGEVTITAARLSRAATAQPERSPRDVAQELVVFELLAQEATQRGLDGDAEVRAALSAAAIPRLLRAVFEAAHGAQSIPRDALERAYQQNITFFVRPPLVVCDHILVTKNKKRPTDPDLDAVAANLAAEVIASFERTPARGREDFRARVDTFRDAAARVGLEIFSEALPAFPRTGVMVEPFSAAVFALQSPGELAPVVQTPFGYHVVRLDSHLEPINRSLEAAEDELRARVLPDLRRKAFREWTDALAARYGVALDADALTAAERE